MMKKAIILLAAIAAFCFSARAQFIGYTAPQTVSVNLATNVNCAPGFTSATGAIPNLGQSVHVVQYNITVSAGSGLPNVEIQGSADGVIFNQISDDGMPGPGQNGILVGYGLYPVVRVVVASGTTGCNLNLSYSGTSVSPPNSVGLADVTVYKKPLFSGVTAGTTENSVTFLAPYGNTSGFIVLSTPGGAPAGSFLQVFVVDVNTSATIRAVNMPVSTLAGSNAQIMVAPNFPGSAVFVRFVSGGASTSTVFATYYFLKPGSTVLPPLCEQTAIINTAAAGPTQIIAAGLGQTVRICSLSVSSGTAEAIDFQQGTGANCGTSNAQLTGLYHAAVNTPVTQNFPGGGLISLPGSAVCIHLSGANQTDGMITYSQY